MCHDKYIPILFDENAALIIIHYINSKKKNCLDLF
jgi:hypothetical protein